MLAMRRAAQAGGGCTRQQRACTHRIRQHVLVQAKGFGFGTKAAPAKQVSKDGRPLLKPGKVSKMLLVPAHISRPPYAATGEMPQIGRRPEVHDAEGRAKMAAAGRLAAQVLQHAGSLVAPGVTTDSIDRAVHKMIIEAGAYPSPLNYGRFPKSMCTSVNECACHGIPDDRPLVDGDIINIDVTVYLNGYHGDTSAMFHVGKVSDEARRLCEVTQLARDEAIKVCGPGVPLKAIGAAIQDVADRHKLRIVPDFIGHGVGKVFHAMPQVFHNRNNEPGTMQLHQTFTIEPILSLGGTKISTWKDQWTAVTADGSLSAQCEHTILITPDGAEVLTKL